MQTQTWQAILNVLSAKPRFADLQSTLANARKQHRIYPPAHQVFNAFAYTPYDQTRVVILGQDPYHRPNQANGLCFSVHPGVKIPPSLVNIYKALDRDLGIPPAAHGDLSHWAKQGVLLLNTVLTVEDGKPHSHAHIGWEDFTTDILLELNNHPNPLVFLLWGKKAQDKAKVITQSKHVLLKSAHPSPLSAYRGFLDCRHFSKTNEILQHNRFTPINWSLPAEPDVMDAIR